MITAIILAAGTSSRMGKSKQLLQLGSKSLIRIVAENVVASCVDEVIVVTGAQATEVSAEIKDLPVQVVYNPNYLQGQGESLAVGMKAITAQTTTIMVLLCDQPFISPTFINFVITAFAARRCLALRPTYNGRPGHPVIFSSLLSPQLLALTGEIGARELLKKLGSSMEYLPVTEEASVLDLDTPANYAKLKNYPL